jgi:hypothetical protein
VSRRDWAAAPLPARVFLQFFYLPGPILPDRRPRSRHAALGRAPRRFGCPWFSNPCAQTERGEGERAGTSSLAIFFSDLLRSMPVSISYYRPPSPTHGHTQHQRSGGGGGAITSTSAARRRTRLPRPRRATGLRFLGGVPSRQAKVSLVLSPSRYSFCFSVGGQVKQRESCFSSGGFWCPGL